MKRKLLMIIFMLLVKLSLAQTNITEINHNTIHNVLPEIASKNYSSTKGFTIICVLISDSTQENTLFTVKKNDTSEIVVTDKRFAKPKLGEYLNFIDYNSSLPRIFTGYVKMSKNDSSDLLTFGKQNDADIPAKDYKGVIAEARIFDYQQPYSKRLIYESYLAVKYGITIDQTFSTSYYDSEGKIIWNSRTNQKFTNAVAGIGRDDNSRLLQKISCSVENPNLLTLSREKINSDASFVLCGHNNGVLKFSRENELKPAMLQRLWLSEISYGKSDDIADSLMFLFDSKQIKELDPLKEGESYYLAIDDGGSGTFLNTNTSYSKSCNNENGLITFNNLKLDTYFDGKSLFSIVAALEMFISVDTYQPTCNENCGKIDVRVVGGKAPYNIVLKTASETVENFQTDNTGFIIQNLKQGIYNLYVTDADGFVCNKNVLLSNSDLKSLPEIDDIYQRKRISDN